MTSRPRGSRRAISAVALLSFVLSPALTGCGFLDKGADAREAAETFAKALENGDVRKVEFTAASGPKQYAAVRKTLDYPTKVSVDQVTRSGDTADVRLNWSIEIDGHAWPLTVTRVYPQVKDGTFVVDLAFQGASPPGLLPGQSLQGRLALGRDEPALTLASGAFLERSGGDYAFVIAQDGRTAERRRIKLGRRNAEQVEVLEGLAAGDRVVVSSYDGLDRIVDKRWNPPVTLGVRLVSVIDDCAQHAGQAAYVKGLVS